MGAANQTSFRPGYDQRREGNGRKSIREFFTLDDWQWRNYRRYLKYSLFQDFKLMAHLARPKAPPRLYGKNGEFDDSVQFHAQQDGEGNPIAGGYTLDPLFEKRIDLCKFRLKELFPKPPKEVEVSGQINAELTLGLHPSMLRTIKEVSRYNNKPKPLAIPSPSPLPVASNGSTNGSSMSSLKLDDLAKSPVSEPTVSEKQS